KCISKDWHIPAVLLAEVHWAADVTRLLEAGLRDHPGFIRTEQREGPCFWNRPCCHEEASNQTVEAAQRRIPNQLPNHPSCPHDAHLMVPPERHQSKKRFQT